MPILTKVRKHQNLLTIVCLGVIGSLAVLLFVLCVTAGSLQSKSGAAHTSSGAGEVFGTGLLILLVTSVGWWVMAKMAGFLWRMNTGISWKFMMCTGALGFVLSALFYDAVVLLVVRRLYMGDDELRLEILPANSH